MIHTLNEVNLLTHSAKVKIVGINLIRDPDT